MSFVPDPLEERDSFPKTITATVPPFNLPTDGGSHTSMSRSERLPVSLPEIAAERVKQPAHYMKGGIETIEYIYAKLGPEGFKAYCLGNVLKYVSRWQEKNGVEDLRKAQVYLQWSINGKP